MADTGTVASFNFDLSSSTVTSTATSLSNQDYSICFRRTSGNCFFCISPSIIPDTEAVIAQASFGISISPAAAAQSRIDTLCSTDYVLLNNGVTATNAAIEGVMVGVNRFCGRYLATVEAATASVTVCSKLKYLDKEAQQKCN